MRYAAFQTHCPLIKLCKINVLFPVCREGEHNNSTVSDVGGAPHQEKHTRPDRSSLKPLDLNSSANNVSTIYSFLNEMTFIIWLYLYMLKINT